MKRPYRGLNRGTGPGRRYDAVIIGAGVGGLTCANLLARAGLRVLLAERHYVVGGYCSAFRRGGYTFDAASHFYPLLGNPATITGRLLVDLGVRTRWVKMDPVDQFHLPDGTTFAVPADLESYLARLKAEFPGEAEGIDTFFRATREAYLLGLLAYFRWRDAAKLDEYRDLTLRRVLDRLLRSPRLKLLLTADCPHWGSPPSRTSFVFDAMLRVAYFLGNYYPQGGSQAFVDDLARCFEERGGHILLNATVKRILVEGGTARGVVLETGHARAPRDQEVYAGAVIANGDMRHTVERLLDPDRLPPEYVALVRGLRPSYPCFLTHVGLRGVPTEALRAVHGYHWADWDAERVGRDALTFKLFVPTLYEPALAPPGGHVLIVQKVTEIDYAAVGDWQVHKAALERKVLAHLGRLLPGFRDHAVVLLSASAATSHRYTLNHHGAMLGWEMSPDQLGPNRPCLRGPVRNLFFVGHWTQPGGGITPVIVSAMRVAELVAETFGTAGVRDPEVRESPGGAAGHPEMALAPIGGAP
jgi:phytoene dehydrogenase-like protein